MRDAHAATREAAKLYQVAVAKEPARWDAWANLAAALSELKAHPHAVRAYEQAILLIEKAQQVQGAPLTTDDDAYLGKLYYGLGMSLVELTPDECAELAAAPDTLLIGVDAGGNAAAASPTSVLAAAMVSGAQLQGPSLPPPLAAQPPHLSPGQFAGWGGGGVRRA